MSNQNNDFPHFSLRELRAKLPRFDAQAAIMLTVGIAMAILGSESIRKMLDSREDNRAKLAAVELAGEFPGAIRRNEIILGSCSSITKARLAGAGRISPTTLWDEPWEGVFHDKYVEITYPMTESRLPEKSAAFIVQHLEGRPGVSAIKIVDGDIVVTYECRQKP